jgi:hypothetical protein
MTANVATWYLISHQARTVLIGGSPATRGCWQFLSTSEITLLGRRWPKPPMGLYGFRQPASVPLDAGNRLCPEDLWIRDKI